MSGAVAEGRVGRAAVVERYGEPLVIREFPVASPEPGGLLVEVDRTTICGSDVHAWLGHYEGLLPIDPPVILGHEIVGRVAEIGAGADVDSTGVPLKVGDRVIWAHEACGHCYACTVQRQSTLCENRRMGMLINCERSPHFHGGFAEYSYVWPRSGRLKVPDEVKSEWAAASSCALRTVIHGMDRLGMIDYGHTVVIQGAGPLALFATAIAATHHPRRIVVIGGPDERLALAREWGADVTIDVAEHGVEARAELVREATDGRGGDVVMEFSGAPGAFAEGIQMAAKNGRYLVVGTLSGPDQPVAAPQVTFKNLSIYGSISADIDSYYRGLEFLRHHRDRFDWDRMIGSSHPLDGVTEALRRMQSFEEIKAVVDPWAGR